VRPTGQRALVKADPSVLPKLWNIPDAIRNRLGREAGPQRAMLEEGHLLIILHQLPNPDEHDRKAALFWRQPSGEWRSNLPGAAPASLQDLLQSFEQHLTLLEDQENNAKSASEYHSVLEQIAPVLRTSRGLHRALQQARELLKSETLLINSRDQAAGVERTAELLLQDAQFGLNFTVAKQAEAQSALAQQMAVTAHRLNLLAALFLPLTALASIFGMEIHSQVKDTPANFWLICLLGVLIGLLVGGFLMRGTRLGGSNTPKSK
jgi:CorA-like Mg2+ transporter protein